MENEKRIIAIPFYGKEILNAVREIAKSNKRSPTAQIQFWIEEKVKEANLCKK